MSTQLSEAKSPPRPGRVFFCPSDRGAWGNLPRCAEWNGDSLSKPAGCPCGTLSAQMPFMQKILFTSTALVLTVLSTHVSAHASTDESGSRAYVGALIGSNVPAGDFGSDNSPNFGITAGAKVAPALGVGFYGTYYGQENSGSVFGLTTATSSGTLVLAGEINAFFSVFHAGANLGVSTVSWSASAGNASVGQSNTSMVYGPEAGFDIPLGPSASHVSVGGEVHYLMTSASEGQSNLQALAALKVWL